MPKMLYNISYDICWQSVCTKVYIRWLLVVCWLKCNCCCRQFLWIVTNTLVCSDSAEFSSLTCVCGGLWWSTPIRVLVVSRYAKSAADTQTVVTAELCVPTSYSAFSDVGIVFRTLLCAVLTAENCCNTNSCCWRRASCVGVSADDWRLVLSHVPEVNICLWLVCHRLLLRTRAKSNLLCQSHSFYVDNVEFLIAKPCLGFEIRKMLRLSVSCNLRDRMNCCLLWSTSQQAYVCCTEVKV